MVDNPFNFDWMDKLVKECPPETRLAVVRWAMKHIVDHAKEGGSYRYLIYDRLGFDMDAYGVLQNAGALEISNEFDLQKMRDIFFDRFAFQIGLKQFYNFLYAHYKYWD